MTPSILVVLLIIAIAAALFVTERLRVDVIALLVLSALPVVGAVTPAEALSGFSNPAVVTVWAMFVISGALARTGVAGLMGARLLPLAGHGEARLIGLIMLVAGVLSAFMNNVGVAALLLPVVMDLARRLKRPPSRLLMPLAYGCLLGGLTTLIGTSPNLLVSDALRDAGLTPFALFDFAWVGVPILLVGITFILLVGRHLLPTHPISHSSTGGSQFESNYDLHSTLFTLRLPPGSPLAGQSVAKSGLGSALGLTLIGIVREGQIQRSPTPDTRLRAGDRLLIEGRRSRLAQLHGWQQLVVEGGADALARSLPLPVALAEVTLAPRATFVGRTVEGSRFRTRVGLTVISLRRNGIFQRTRINHELLREGDVLLVEGARERVAAMDASDDFEGVRFLSETEAAEQYQLEQRMLRLRVPRGSALDGKTLRESRLGDALDLTVIAIERGGDSILPTPDARLAADDALLVKGHPTVLAMVHGLQSLQFEEPAPRLSEMESATVGLCEVVLSPHTTLVGKSLRELHFREKYGLSVLAIFREGEDYHAELGDMPLRFGDALLLYGPRAKVKILAAEADFVVLTEVAQEAPRLEKAPVALGVMVAVLLPVLAGHLPIALAAVIGATLMVVLGCLTMEEAYRYIDWKAVFLIAGMLPLGIALQESGAARFLAEGLVVAVGGASNLVAISGLFWITTIATQIMPNPAVTVLMAPIALSSARDLGASPYAFIMVVAIAACASFLSPVSHPANILIMGPGGYRFRDYIRVGFPLTIVVWLVTLLLLPVVWGG